MLRALGVTVRPIYYLRYRPVTLLSLGCVIFEEDGHSTYTPEPHTAAGIHDVKKKINTAGSRGETGHFKSWAGGLRESSKEGAHYQGYFTSRALMSYH